MMTVHEVSQLAGVSVRALHHYHQIGLLRPAKISEAGYRLYDDAALERLQYILLFRELQFPLREIKGILDSPDFDRNRALEQQIALLRMKKEHLENLIDLACGIKMTGVKNLDFTAFDTKKIDEYARQAKESWGHTPEFRQFQEKAKGRTREQEREISVDLMGILAKFGEMQQLDPAERSVREQVKKLQDFITEHFYDCSNEILWSLGQMYAGGGSMTENIDKAGGEGTAEFAARAIQAYCDR
ncbi:MAG: MerR family transcriptional regulator [Lachnospiraceae bacterium]|nr:MerR family transcriptional regulator [Lachnospiraceae bacterium]MCI9545480.1 MerR family transcriptional regulator [Lachnospiraceae bacterium]